MNQIETALDDRRCEFQKLIHPGIYQVWACPQYCDKCSWVEVKWVPCKSIKEVTK